MQSLGTLNNPNIVKYLDYIETPDSFYLVMEYCNGGDLTSYI